MKLPKHLYHTYKLLNTCKLVKGECTSETLAEFETFLNSSRPSEPDLVLYEFISDMYHSNKIAYIKYIRNTPSAQSTILWTDAHTIVNWFGLYGRVFLRFDKTTQKYDVSMHKNYNSETFQESKPRFDSQRPRESGFRDSRDSREPRREYNSQNSKYNPKNREYDMHDQRDSRNLSYTRHRNDSFPDLTPVKNTDDEEVVNVNA